MAQTIEAKGTYGTYYYIDSSSASDVLTMEEMKANALYIYSWCKDLYPDWTVNAIAAMCGNFQHEGVMNPSQWQYGYNMSTEQGYGLGQWTPATKLLNWLSSEGYPRYEIDGQMARIAWEAANNQQWISTSSYPMSFSQFLGSEESPADLASAWLYDWERPLDPSATEAIRRQDAEFWYEYLSGEEPTPPEPVPEKRKRMSIIFYHRRVIYP